VLSLSAEQQLKTICQGIFVYASIVFTASGRLHTLLRRRLTSSGLLLAASALALLLHLPALAESPSAFPVDITAARAPQPVMADGRDRLLYELHVTNFSAKPIELTALDVLDGDDSSPLASYRGEALEKLLVAVGSEESAGKIKTRAIGGGRSVLIFLDLTLDSGMRVPVELRHRLSFSIAVKDGTIVERTVNGPVVAVDQTPAPVLRAPLRGAGWVAANGLSNPDHRRSFVPVDGKVRIAQRFAIDWVQLGPDGRLFHGAANSNANYYGYGADVVAVADARVSNLKDGLAENAGSNEPSNRAITLDNVAGNYLILDLGNGRFALYAHLQPGSLKVKLGDTVKAGDVLARLGNSGNSDAPHLHFHLMDANSPLGAEGIPYELETFTQTGLVEDQAVIDSGQAWRPKTQAAPVVHRREFPVDNAVVTFP
jgi:murein DD-endopeptidase MepM/ murein hydrolase activator NlpD